MVESRNGVLRRVGLFGTGSYAPEKVYSNADFEKMVDTTDEWITTRTGIKERHIAAEDEATSTMAVRAARSALEAAGIAPEELDLIVVGTVTPDHPFPASACLIQRELGAWNAAAFDLSAACAGFLYGVSVASQFVATGAANNVLVVGADTLSRIVNYKDRGSCILFGDGAGCAVLSSRDGGHEILPSGTLHADGRGAEVIYIHSGGSQHPITHEALETRLHQMQVSGREVYKFAVSKFVDLVRGQLEAHPDLELGLVIPHQVNQRIIDSARSRLGLPEEKVYSNIARFGNTSAASIPIALDELVRSGQMDEHRGKLIVFCAFGAGLAWGSAAMRW